MAGASKTTSRARRAASGKGGFKRQPGTTLVLSYGGGTRARIAQPDGTAYPEYAVGSGEFYAAIAALDNGEYPQLAENLEKLGWADHLAKARELASGGDEEIAEAA